MVNEPASTYATLFRKFLRIIMLVAVVVIFSRIHPAQPVNKGVESTVQNSWRRALPWYVVGFVVLWPRLTRWFPFNPAVSEAAHGAFWLVQEVTALAAIGLRLNFLRSLKLVKKLAVWVAVC